MYAYDFFQILKKDKLTTEHQRSPHYVVNALHTLHFGLGFCNNLFQQHLLENKMDKFFSPMLWPNQVALMSVKPS